MEFWVWWVTAAVSLISAMFMLLTPNAVHAALLLVVNFFTLAVFYVLLEAHFLAAAQVIVYAGAIMVLFLFVIMLLGVDRTEDLRESITGQRTIAVVFFIALVGLALYTVRSAFDRTPFASMKDANAGGNVQGVGRVLFTSYLFPFEVTSLLLIVAAIGAIVIGKRRSADEREMEDDDA